MIAVGLVAAWSCEKDYYLTPPPPPKSDQTATLEASFVNVPPATVNASYWKTADYLKVTSANVSTGQLYTDGLLNMTGSYNGLASFNNGTDSGGLTLKAAYDKDNLYILAEWTDLDVDASYASWLWKGPVDPKKSDTTGGWTSQRNCDRIAFAFEINSASGPAGTFTNTGCAASCHNSGGNMVMHPTSGKVDLWNWNLATSAPMGYARDMVADDASLSDDSGQKVYARNVNGVTDRSGPAFEWDGTTQNVTLPGGQNAILDPAFYLLNKTPFTGDIMRGDSIYHRLSPPGDCASCHGEKGEGGIAGAINGLTYNKKSRAALIAGMDVVADMGPYWGSLTSTEKDDIVAYLRGLSGVPGYYLQTPDGSNADIKTLSNVTPVQIKDAMLPVTNIHTKYQVLFIRKLSTSNPDDAQFDVPVQKIFKFGVALMDNDGRNHIGSAVETLTFK